MEFESSAMLKDEYICSSSSISMSRQWDYRPGEDAETVDHVDQTNVEIAKIAKSNKPKSKAASKVSEAVPLCHR